MPFTFPNSKVFCPFCFHEFHIGHAPFRDYSDNHKEKDPVQAAFFDRRVEEHPDNYPVKEIQGFWHKLIGYFYYSRSLDKKRRICPHCHMTLPNTLANSGKQGNVIAVIGYRNSGKGNFFGVLIPSLRTRYAKEISLSLEALDSYNTDGKMANSDTLYRERYGDNLEQMMAVPPTPKISLSPMLYCLKLDKFTIWQRILNPFSHHRPVDLILFDAAGEGFAEAEIQIHSSYISHASGIIILLDPTSYKLRGMRNTINQSEYFDTFATITNAMARYNPHYRKDKQVKTPLAVVISKFDELRPDGQPLEGLHESVFYDHCHAQGFNKKAVDETSEHLYDFLDKREIKDVLANLKQYSNWKLFGMASLGHPPVGHPPDANLQSIDPINIADPLLWILYELGHIAAKKEKK